MAWLVCEGKVLASVEVADSARTRARGLLGRDRIDGAIVIRPCRAVHTFGMRFALDVAHLDADGVVLHISHLRRFRLGRPVLAARQVVEAEAGAFERWGLQIGDRLEVRE